MEELQVRVEQTPGAVTWNFEDLKAALRSEMESYKGLVYTDETIPVAKKDRALLRKLKEMVEDRRKEIKNRCLEPYTLIESQAKELTALIDEPINLIDQQVKKYEREQKEKRKSTIDQYMNEKFSSFPKEIQVTAQAKIYDVRWLNATFKEKEWKDAVNECADEINRCLDILNKTELEFREEAFNTYGRNLDLSEAVARVQELQAQKEKILAAERRRKEEEERRKAEQAMRIAEEERRRKEMEAERKEAHRVVQANQSVADPTVSNPSVEEVVENVRADASVPMPETPGYAYTGAEMAVKDEADGSILIRVYGAPEEQKKILDYCGFLGVRYEVL